MIRAVSSKRSSSPPSSERGGVTGDFFFLCALLLTACSVPQYAHRYRPSLFSFRAAHTTSRRDVLVHSWDIDNFPRAFNIRILFNPIQFHPRARAAYVGKSSPVPLWPCRCFSIQVFAREHWISCTFVAYVAPLRVGIACRRVTDGTPQHALRQPPKARRRSWRCCTVRRRHIMKTTPAPSIQPSLCTLRSLLRRLASRKSRSERL